MAAIKLLDFKDIQDAVLEELKIPATDTKTLTRVKRNINSIYVNKVVPATRWPWLRKRINLVHEQFYDTGTANVGLSSITVVLSEVIAIGEGSKKDFLFSVNGFSEIYKIDAHTAGSDTLTLSSVYTGETQTTAGYRIWTDEVSLPTDCRETIDVRHDFKSRVMIAKGSQKLDEESAIDFRREDRPRYYSTDDFKDPTSGTGETESDRFRVFRVWPSMFNEDTTLHVTYIQEVTPLDTDADEPVMPIEDRIVLVYGALMQSWLRERNEQTAEINAVLFRAKLAEMQGRYEDSSDMPRIEIDDSYMRSKRGIRRRHHA